VKKLLLIVVFLGGIAGVVCLFWLRSGNSHSGALAARQSAMERLGKSISKARPGAKVLVVSNPFTRDAGYFNEKTLFERAGIAGLQKGLGKKSQVVVAFPDILPDYFSNPGSVFIPQDSRTPVSFLLQTNAIEKLADSHPDCQVIVSLIGLPPGIEQGKLWESSNPKAFALLLPDLRFLGTTEKAVEAIQNGKLLAIVGAEDREPLIVSRENAQDVVQRMPSALGF
jgi:hypothetical protein